MSDNIECKLSSRRNKWRDDLVAVLGRMHGGEQSAGMCRHVFRGEKAVYASVLNMIILSQ